MRANYANEKLSAAIYELAIGEGDVRSRLWKAYLSFHTLSANDFPAELQQDWNWIVTNMNSQQAIYDHKNEVAVGSVQNTLWHIRNSTGSKIAARIMNIYYKLQEYKSSRI